MDIDISAPLVLPSLQVLMSNAHIGIAAVSPKLMAILKMIYLPRAAPPSNKTENMLTLVQSVDIAKSPALTTTKYLGNMSRKDGNLSPFVVEVSKP